jgi:hypothetical protein
MTLFRLTMPLSQKRPNVPAFPSRAGVRADRTRLHREAWPAAAWLAVLPRAARCVARPREAGR